MPSFFRLPRDAAWPPATPLPGPRCLPPGRFGPHAIPGLRSELLMCLQISRPETVHLRYLSEDSLQGEAYRLSALNHATLFTSSRPTEEVPFVFTHAHDRGFTLHDV
jgi:hypothetical protein